MPDAGDRELTRNEAVAFIETMDRRLDRGDTPGWTESIHLVAAARWAVTHGYTLVVSEHDAEVMSI